MEKCCNLTLATWGVKTEDGFIRCPECKESYPPNTQGASWEEEFDERFGVICDGLIPFSEQYSANDYKDFIRTLLSKEREEGEEEGRRDMYKQLKPFLDPFATLPTDTTEEITNKD